MRILLLNQFYVPDVAATGQLLSDLAVALVRRGHEVHVLCSRRPYGGGTGRYPAKEVRDGVNVHRVGATGFGRSRLIGRLLDYLSYYVLAAVRAMLLPHMDVCVCLTTPPLIARVGLWLRWLRRTRLVLWTMDLYPQVAVAYGHLKPRGLLHWWLTRKSRVLYRRADAILSLGETMTQRLIEAGAEPGKITTTHNWVPGEVVQPMPAGPGGGRVTLMYSGNLGLGHELDTAVHAVARLKDLRDLRAVFVGAGRMLRQLQALVADLDLTNVSFRPPQPLEKLSESLAAGDIHLVSQRPGTQGLIVPSKLYGILAAGRPVLYIGPDDCEVAQIVTTSGCGIVVPPGDEQAAAAALRQLATDADLRNRMGRKGRAYYTEHFGMARSTTAHAEAIERAAGATLDG